MTRIAFIAGLLTLSGSAGFASGYSISMPRSAAGVRFTNHLSETRVVTLEANKRAVFSEVGPSSTTSESMVQDTVVTFDLKWAGSDTVVATSNSPLASGGHYTVTATRANGTTPILIVLREPVEMLK
ncbi:MAG: hypothetical protein ABIZ70_14840 [Gemmatimonadales bacterium]